MATLPTLLWIGNAAAVLCGHHGAITRQTQQAGCSRQAAYDHADRVRRAVDNERLPGPDRQQLLDDNQALRSEQQRLQRLLDEHVALGPDAPKRFAVTAGALGLSLNQAEELLTALLGPQAPDRSSLGRWLTQATQQAQRVLGILDAASRSLTKTLAIDEIFFHGRPVLVGVEPRSFATLLCQRAANRTGDTWAEALRPFAGLEYAVHDAGTGLTAGVAALNAERLARGAPPLADGLDLFHTAQEAQRLLGRLWRQVEARWAEAEAADQRTQQTRQRGQDARGSAARARAAWGRAVESFRWYEHWEGLWRRAQAALRLYRPDGQLNDRAGASAELAAVCAGLKAAYWKKLRGYLQDRRLLTFLDLVHERLAAAETCAPLREALVRLQRLEWEARGGEALALSRVAVQRVVCAKWSADWTASYRRVCVALRGVVRASSAVECVNSVLRMHQGRHRTVSQGLLDLKRLYWNSRAFREGQRKGQCPYQHLGLRLPSYDFWTLLQSDPQVLSQELSTAKAAA
jgi:hypothetical protein